MVVAKTGELKKTVLVLGDGDFAFSARLASAGLFFVTATTVESEADLEARYPDSFPKHRAQVNTCGGRCLFGVDARELGSSTAPYVHFSESFDRLVWHNPYTEGADLQTHRSLAAKRVHKSLVKDFLGCASAVLRKGGTLVVSINPSQSALVGEDFLLAAARKGGFALLQCYPFDTKREHEYHVRYGDERDVVKTRRTYTKRSLRTYEFGRLCELSQACSCATGQPLSSPAPGKTLVLTKTTLAHSQQNKEVTGVYEVPGEHASTQPVAKGAVAALFMFVATFLGVFICARHLSCSQADVRHIQTR
jgi:hypothetical protein